MFQSFVRGICTGICVYSKKPPVQVFGIEGRYASALYSAAHEMKQLYEVETHLVKMLNELETEPKMKDFVLSVDVAAAKKAEALKYAGEKTGMPQAAVNFLMLVAENGRLKELKKIITLFLIIMASHKNEAVCEVITAKPLDDQTRQALLEALSKHVSEKEIKLTEKVQPEIIGGMIVGIDDKFVDMSISSKMKLYTDILKQAI